MAEDRGAGAPTRTRRTMAEAHQAGEHKYPRRACALCCPKLARVKKTGAKKKQPGKRGRPRREAVHAE